MTVMGIEHDADFMRAALEEARKAEETGEVPVGAVLVSDAGRVIASGFNQPVSSHDPTAHAEIIAMRKGALHLKNYRLPGSILYVTLEPCLMCWGAILHARISRVVFGAKDERYSAEVSELLASSKVKFNHRVEITGGVMSEECSAILRHFFEKKR